MKVLFFVLNDSNLLSPLLKELKENGIKGCTILDSSGMGRALCETPDDFSMLFGTLRNMLKPNLSSNKTLMMVLEECKVDGVVQIIDRIAGPLDQPGTGVVFTFPVDFVKGLKL